MPFYYMNFVTTAGRRRGPRRVLLLPDLHRAYAPDVLATRVSSRDGAV